jgi:hypothetical protein
MEWKKVAVSSMRLRRGPGSLKAAFMPGMAKDGTLFDDPECDSPGIEVIGFADGTSNDAF